MSRHRRSNETAQHVGVAGARWRRWLAAVVAPALGLGGLVGLSVLQATPAVADPDRPTVTIAQGETLILGEDLSLDVTIANDSGAAGIYNLSASILLPADVAVQAVPFGTATTYAAGTVLPGAIVGTESCTDLGLVAAPSPATGCAVPADLQLLVIENFSDLPAGASVTETLTVRPKAFDGTSGYQVGDTVPVVVNAYTSSDERYVPVFPGSTGVGTTAAQTATSGRGGAAHDAPVKALRIEKSEPSPEQEILRGAHEQSVLYTLTIDHTGQGDLSDARVVDFLPANLEFLGCGTVDNTTNANGNRGGGANSVEYDGAARLDDATPDVSSCVAADAVVTVEADSALLAQYPDAGLVAGDVYTMVTWNVGTWLQSSGGVAQAADLSAAGVAGTTTIQYRAAVPLFENTLDFGYTPDTTGQQTANLDNNRGASTRHGDADAAAADAAKMPTTATNWATAFGTWNSVVSSDSDWETVEVTDVRLLKDVKIGTGAWGDRASFVQGTIADYRLRIQTSEYVTAELAGAPTTITDTLGNGLCPVFPSGTAAPTQFLWTDASGTTVLDASTFNADLTAIGLDECAWGGSTTGSTFTGAAIETLQFDEMTGRFTQTFLIDPATALDAPNATHDIVYSVHKNSNYLTVGGKDGATSSGDLIPNDADLEMLTTAVADVNGLTNSAGVSAGDEVYARETSWAELEADYSDIDKQVLQHAYAGASTTDLLGYDHPSSGATTDVWTKDEAEPFAVGDEVWFKLHWEPSDGADIRNPVITDFLPEGLVFDETLLDAANEWQDSPNLRVYAMEAGGAAIDPATDLPVQMGVCNIATEPQAYAAFVGAVDVSADGRKLTWDLGSDDCFPTGNPSEASDRFFPRGYWLDIYVRATVVDADAYGEVDLAKNLVKYQQENVDGEIFFLRDEAGIAMDTSAKLVKGIEQINTGTVNAWNSNVDASTNASSTVGQVVQDDEVTFRLDVTAPVTDTSDYVILDALPDGLLAADLVGYDNSTHAITASGELSDGTPIDAMYLSARAYDWDAGASTWPGLPASVSVSAAYQGRTIVVWEVAQQIPGSDLGDPDATPPVAATERGFSLLYTVEVPDGAAGAAAEITQQYVNVASIQQFNYVNASGGETTVMPTLDAGATTAETGADWNGGSAEVAPVAAKSPDTAAGEYPITADKATDPSRIKLPGVTFDKTLIETEIKPADDAQQSTTNSTSGADNVITQGETVTFEYAITLPANTTVEGLAISDDDVLKRGSANVSYTLVDVDYYQGATGTTAVTCGTAATDFRCVDGPTSGKTGILTFPDTYTTGAAAETFRVRITLYTGDAGNNDVTLTNTARYVFDDPNTPGSTTTGSDAATVRYREPNLGITKSASPASDVAAGETVTYVLAVTNANRVISYDNVIVDTVPAGLLIDEDSFKIGTSNDYASATSVSAGTAGTDAVGFSTAGLTTGSGGTITWSYEKTGLGSLGEVPGTVYLFYQAEVDPSTGAAQTYTNTADVDGHTLPATLNPDATTRRGDRSATDDATITAATAALAKGVRIAGTTDAYADEVSVPVGETVQYEIVATLEANINYYDPKIVDDLPAGAVLKTATISGPTASDGASTITGTWTRTEDTSTNTHTWTYDGDILSATTARTLTLTYEVLLSDAIGDAVTDMPNTASFTWNRVNGDNATSTSLTDDANVDLLDPVMEIVKQVDGEDAVTRQVDDTFAYEITVTNTGDTPAYHVVVEDDVPAGVKVDTTTITPAPTSVDAGVSAGAGGTITWTIAGPIHETGSTSTPTEAQLGYTAEFADSTTLTTSSLVNTAEVTDFESFPTGGRNYDPTGVDDTASVTPLFPNVVPTKTVTNPVAGQTYGVAYVGEAFNWTLNVQNTGNGTAKDVSVTDVLPENWEYVAGSAQLIIGSGAPQALGDPSVSGTTTQTLTWSESQLSGATPSPATPLAAGAGFTITFDAKPTAAALATPGTGIPANAHRNTLSVTATDEQGNDHNADGDYVGPDSTADAYIAEADLKLVKDALGGVAAVQTDPTAPLYNVPEDTWVAGQSVVAGVYDQPQWKITVTNQGPDASYGPFELVDTTTLPAGVTTGTWTAMYYANSSDTTGTVLSLTGSGTSADPYVVGSTGTSLKANGSDRIELVANVTIADTATGTAENVASVTGRTYESQANIDKDNSDDAEKPITTAADLRIVKTITDPASPNVPNVGDTITWELTVTNHGPSVSVSTTANPIVITDTVPAGMTGVTATSNTDWTATLSDGSPIPAGGVDAGTEILWTYQGASMPLGATAAVQLTGTIATSFTGTLTNTAKVEPGDTPDPATPNNESTVHVDPDDSTTVSITKTRVVWDTATSSWVNATNAVVWGDQVSYRIDVENNGPADARDVQVVDETPVGFTYDSHANLTGTWTRTADGTTSTGTNPLWDTFALAGTLPDTETRSFVVTYDTDPSGTGTVENWAEVTIENWDPTDPGGHFDRDDDNSNTSRVVDLGIVKNHTGTGPFTAGETVEYTLVVTNHGPSTTSGVVEIEDSLPAGMSYVAGSAAVTVPTGATAPATDEPTLSGTDNRVLTWNVLTATDAFAPTQQITITFEALIDPSVRAGANLENAAEVDGPDNEPTPDPNPNRDTDDITTDTEATMEIVKTVEAGPWVAGTDVEYTLTVTNSGPSEASASVTDTLPAGMTLVSMSGTGWDCPADVTGLTTATCTYLDMADTDPITQVLHPIGTTTITVVAHIASSAATGSTLTNTAEVDWTDSRGSHSDDDTEDVVVTANADLRLEKKVLDGAGAWVDSAAATAGEGTSFRLTVTNDGPSAAVGPITVVDTLPAGIAFVALDATSATDWTATVDPSDPQQVTFALQPTSTGIASGATAPVIVFEVALDAALPATNAPTVPALTNTATVTSGTTDPTPGNNTDTADVEVTQLVDLAIAKGHLADDVRIGDPLAFDLAVANAGPSTATGVTVTERIPAGLTYVDHAGSDAAWSEVSVTPDAVTGETVVVYALSTPIAPMSTAPALTVNTTVELAAYPSVTNVAAVTGDEPEDPSTTGDNETTDPVVVPPQSTLTIVKAAVGTFAVGSDGRYRITVTNDGVTEDPGPIVVTDDLPDGLTFRSATSDGMTCELVAGVVTCTSTRTLGVGEDFVIDLVVGVGAAAYPTVTNTAVVATPTEQLPGGDPSDSATVTVDEGILAYTGAQMNLALVVIAAMLVAGGVGATAIARRRGREA